MVRLGMNPAHNIVAAGLMALLLAGCAGSGGGGSTAAAPAAEAEPLTVHTQDRWRIAGQPQPADLQREAELGTAMVVNLRTDEEVAQLDFDPQAEAESRGMRYIHIPLGGDAGYEPADVEAFAAAVEQTDGPVLVYCRSGNRARMMWAAYMVQSGQMPVDSAMRGTHEMGAGYTPLEQLLGREVVYSLGDPLPEGDDGGG